MPRIPIADQHRDPSLAPTMMGVGNVTVLPSPLLGSYTTRDLRVVELNCTLAPDASPVLLETLVHRLQDQYDVITWRWVDGSDVARILTELGFYGEQPWNPDLKVNDSLLVWRRPVIPVGIPS